METEEPALHRPETGWRSDGELLRLYAEHGSEAAFTELGHRYARLIYSTCLRETGDQTLAEDAAQGVLLLLSRKARELRRAETVAGWLYVASRYVSKNLLKQERRRQMNEARAALTVKPHAPEANPLWEEVEPHFYGALNRLKPADRTAILLRFVQEQSLAEVGASLGVSENTARMRVNRSLNRIRMHLAKAGIALSIAALATLLEERTAQAVSERVYRSLHKIAAGSGATADGPISNAVSQTGARMSLHAARRLRLPLLGCVMLLGGFAVYRSSLPQRLSLTDQRRLFQALRGTWQGRLEFADDLTGKHYTYPTTAVFDPGSRGDTLQFTATYAGSASRDVTLINGSALPGRVTVYNGGPQSSHVLSGTGDLLRLRAGSDAFVGFSAARNRYVCLRFIREGNRLTLEEDYRPTTWSAYQFRNRFTLSRR